jgi:hypothetical protein
VIVWQRGRQGTIGCVSGGWVELAVVVVVVVVRLYVECVHELWIRLVEGGVSRTLRVSSAVGRRRRPSKRLRVGGMIRPAWGRRRRWVWCGRI